MAVLRYLSHPQVLIDPAVPVPRWSLSDHGRSRMPALSPLHGWRLAEAVADPDSRCQASKSPTERISQAVTTPPRLEVQNLNRAFDGQRVVADVSFGVPAGQVACLLGPSGCGKSTTLRMIAGVDMQDSGRIFVDGKLVCDTVFRLPPERRAIGLMFQDFALFPHLPVSENVAFGLKGGHAANRARVAELLDRVRMTSHIDSYPHELSGGEQQRVALARALAPRPRVLLMDEPFSGLDERLRDGIRDETLALLKEEGTAVLLVTHEPHEAMRMADQILLMRDGRIVQQGAPYNLYNAPADRQVAAFFSDINVLTGLVRGSLTATPFGDFLTPGLPDGTPIDIVIRPQHLKIDFDRGGKGPAATPEDGSAALARVVRARYLGRESLVEFRTEQDAIALNATLPGVFLPPEGTKMWLMLRRDRVFVFPRGQHPRDLPVRLCGTPRELRQRSCLAAARRLAVRQEFGRSWPPRRCRRSNRPGKLSGKKTVFRQDSGEGPSTGPPKG